MPLLVLLLLIGINYRVFGVWWLLGSGVMNIKIRGRGGWWRSRLRHSSWGPSWSCKASCADSAGSYGADRVLSPAALLAPPSKRSRTPPGSSGSVGSQSRLHSPLFPPASPLLNFYRTDLSIIAIGTHSINVKKYGWLVSFWQFGAN